VVQSILSREAADEYDPDGPPQLSDRAYDAVVRALLQWWSLGTINIEVFDGERFNQEIFMGFLDLLLNGFMVLIKKPEELEIKGSFLLQKQKPTERVSGSVKLHAFMHPPEKVYLEQLLEAPVAAKGPTPDAHSSDRPARSARQSDPRHHLHEDSENDDTDDRASASSQSPPEPQRPEGSSAIYSSKFMQALARESLQALSPPPPPPAAGNKAAHAGSMLPPHRDYASELHDPQLEESGNILFNAHTGETASLRNISESARLLKEKVRSSKTARRPRSRTSQPSDGPDQVLSTVQEGAGGAHHHQESSDTEEDTDLARLATPALASLQGSRIPIPSSSLATLMSVSREQKERSIGRGNVRRRSMEDITERLAGLSAVQHSTDTVLGNLADKLEAKLRSKTDTPPITRQISMPTDAELSAALESPPPARLAPKPTRRSQPAALSRHTMEEVRRRMASAQLREPVDEAEDVQHSDEDGDVPPPPAPSAAPSAQPVKAFSSPQRAPVSLPASPQRDALQSSYHSQEDDDVPEMGAVSDEHDDFFSEENDTLDEGSFESNGDEGSEEFEDTYEDEAEGNSDDVDPAEARTKAWAGRAVPEAVKDEAGEEFWEYQSDTDGASQHSQEHMVHTAKRSNVNMAAVPAHSGQNRDSQVQAREYDDEDSDVPVVVDLSRDRTIYAHDSDEGPTEDRAEGGYSMRANRSGASASSVYSTSIMDFLSPDKSRCQPDQRTARSAVDQKQSGSDEEEGSSDELIVIRTSSLDGNLNNSTSGSAGSRRFDVPPAHLAAAPTAQQQTHSHRFSPTRKGSPSRSLFSGAAADLPSLQGSARKSSPRNSPAHSSGQRRVPGQSPGCSDGKPHRVVLELDDLEL
jgi:hypothetical protein